MSDIDTSLVLRVEKNRNEAEARAQKLLAKVKAVISEKIANENSVIVDVGCGSPIAWEKDGFQGNYEAVLLNETAKDKRFHNSKRIGIDILPQAKLDENTYVHIQADITRNKVGEILNMVKPGSVDVFFCQNLLLNISPSLEATFQNRFPDPQEEGVQISKLLLSVLEDMKTLLKPGGVIALDDILFVKQEDGTFNIDEDQKSKEAYDLLVKRMEIFGLKNNLFDFIGQQRRRNLRQIISSIRRLY